MALLFCCIACSLHLWDLPAWCTISWKIHQCMRAVASLAMTLTYIFMHRTSLKWRVGHLHFFEIYLDLPAFSWHFTGQNQSSTRANSVFFAQNKRQAARITNHGRDEDNDQHQGALRERRDEIGPSFWWKKKSWKFPGKKNKKTYLFYGNYTIFEWKLLEIMETIQSLNGNLKSIL